MGDCDEGEVDFVSGGAPYDGHDGCRERIQELEAEVERLRSVREALETDIIAEMYGDPLRSRARTDMRQEVARLRIERDDARCVQCGGPTMAAEVARLRAIEAAARKHLSGARLRCSTEAALRAALVDAGKEE